MMIKNFLFFLLIAYTAHITAPLVAMEQMTFDSWKSILAFVSARDQLNFASTCKAFNTFYNEYGYDMPCSECVINVANIKYDQTGIHLDQRVVSNISKKTKVIQNYLVVKAFSRDGIFEKISAALTQNTQLSTLHTYPNASYLLEALTATYPSAQLPLKKLIIDRDPMVLLISNGMEILRLNSLLKQMPRLRKFKCWGEYVYCYPQRSSFKILNQLEPLFKLKKVAFNNCIFDKETFDGFTDALQKNVHIEECILKKITFPNGLGIRCPLPLNAAIALAQAANTPGNPLIVLDLSDNGIDSKALCIALRDGLTIRL